MTILIQLNGPPGIGKSTLAAMYADRHPGTLNLDIDRLHPLVGGWQDPETHTHELLRPVALAMAGSHLGGGHDVVVPQYLATSAEIEAFERVADDHGATFAEVVLLNDRQLSVDRFDRRPDDSDWAVHNRRIVAVQGGNAFLEAMYDRLLELVQDRPSAVVVRSEAGMVEPAYASLVRALDHFDDHRRTS